MIEPRTVVLAGIVTGVIDGLFSSVLSAVFYGSTVARLFQGVAATVLGPKALDGGTAAALIGVLIHFGVALGWAVVFAWMVQHFAPLRRTLARPGGPLAIAAIYGPLIWVVMSLGIIPQLTGRSTPISTRWWVQLTGHIPFVALPIVTIIGLPFRPLPARADAAGRVS